MPVILMYKRLKMHTYDGSEGMRKREEERGRWLLFLSILGGNTRGEREVCLQGMELVFPLRDQRLDLVLHGMG